MSTEKMTIVVLHFKEFSRGKKGKTKISRNKIDQTRKDVLLFKFNIYRNYSLIRGEHDRCA